MKLLCVYYVEIRESVLKFRTTFLLFLLVSYTLKYLRNERKEKQGSLILLLYY